MPPISFWFTGTAIYLFGSFVFAITVGLIGVRQMISAKMFYALCSFAIILSGLAWRTAAVQEHDSFVQSRMVSDLQSSNGQIKNSLGTQTHKLDELTQQNKVLLSSISTIAGAANIDPNQSARDIANKIIDRLSAQNAARQDMLDEQNRKRGEQANILAEFVNEGTAICQEFGSTGDTEIIKIKSRQWLDKVTDYLLVHLGPIYLAPFQSAQGGSTYLTGRSIEGDVIYNGIQARLQVLNSFIGKLTP